MGVTLGQKDYLNALLDRDGFKVNPSFDSYYESLEAITEKQYKYLQYLIYNKSSELVNMANQFGYEKIC